MGLDKGVGSGDQLRIELQRDADRLIVRLAGELDMASAPSLQEALEGSEPDAGTMLVLDVQQLRFIDSTGLRVILWARERCQDRDLAFALTPGSPQVQRLLAISGAGEHLRIIDRADEVLA
jgi:anti-sigma B factor antagonist